MNSFIVTLTCESDSRADNASGAGPSGVSAQTMNPRLLKTSIATSVSEMRLIIFIKVILPFPKFGQTFQPSIFPLKYFAGWDDRSRAKMKEKGHLRRTPVQV